MKRLADIGEDALIGRLLSGFSHEGMLVGPGDDCAVIDSGQGLVRLLKTDAIVEQIHFLPDALPAEVGWKAVGRVLSDFAAMGGRPDFVLVTVALPSSVTVEWVESLYLGIRRCLETHGGILAGGETTSVPAGAPAMISVAGEGHARRDAWVGRAGGRPGDVLAVTGHLGGSISGKHLQFSPRLREGEVLAAAGARAMMDLSDGLAKDLPRLAKASGCGFQVEESLVPRTEGCSVAEALGDGEDYELLVAVPPSCWDRLRREWAADLAPLTAIGRLADDGGELVGGWEHFHS
ncbi:MAG: thiamine-phosphate kinase [Verrucomicrobiales bacterium]